MSLDPQNPYRSCVVRASAGSGKTYQLSRRFLFLVGAGAHPSSILTVTFTKKAAGEMRERILGTAAQLLKDPAEQEAFDRIIKSYYADTDHLLHRPQPPRSAIATAEAVLSSTQSLRIATIDAVMVEWMRKFPYEAGAQGELLIPPSFEMMSQRDEEQLHRQAWFQCVEELKSSPQLAQRWLALRDRGMTLLDLELRIRELSKHESFLWLLHKTRHQESVTPTFLAHPVPPEKWDDSPEGFLTAMQGKLQAVCSLLAPAKVKLAIAAIEQQQMEQLIELRVLTKTWEIHNGTFRKPKRDAYEHEIDGINDHARAMHSYRSRAELNELGEFLLQLYHIYERQEQRCKHDMGRMAFSDLIKGGYHLFNRPEAAGVRFLLHRTIRHLLLDEFQDTSILQWSMFGSMANEMLAGEGLRGKDEVPSSLFIVGDAKQSIYGFREAEAEVLREAAQFMASREALDISLSTSYRTAPTLLRYINQVFTGRMPDFPEHSTALKGDGSSVIPGSASLTIGPLFADSTVAMPLTEEAKFVAEALSRLLSDPETAPVWDKQRNAYRRLEAGDCAILYRAATHASVYAEACRAMGLAVRLEEGRSFFERLEIKDLMAFCKWMSLPSHTEAFMHVLKSPLFRLQDSVLLHAFFKISAQQTSRYERHLRILEELRPTYPEAVERLLYLLERRNSMKPQTLLRRAADQGSWTQAFASCFGAEEGLLAAANIARFFETVNDLEVKGYFDWMPLQQKLEELAAEHAVSLASVSENAVQLMTIHKAKGLEFPVVVLVGTGEEWEKTDPYWAKIKESHLGSGMAYVGRRSDRPANDSHFERLADILHAEAYQENMRLLYVALTRAQYHLIISGHQRKKSSQKPGFYQILREAALERGAKEQAWADTASSVLHVADPRVGALPLEQQGTPVPQALPLQTLQAWQPSRAKLGAIKILAPARLLDDYEDHAASGLAHPYASEIGTFIHKGLEALVKDEPFDGPLVWSSLSKQRTDFMEAWPYAQGKLDKLLRAPSLRQLLDQAIARHAELSIAFLHRDQLVRGTIDLLLQLAPDRWLVVDYKTSEEASASSDLRALALQKRYDQQLGLYMKGVQLLYPGAQVAGAIFFTAPEAWLHFPSPHQGAAAQETHL